MCCLAFAKEVHDMSVKSSMSLRMAMRTQHLENVCLTAHLSGPSTASIASEPK